MLAWVMTAGLTVLAGCDIEDFGDSQRYTADFHYTYPLKSGARLLLETFNGSVEITGWDQDSVDISGSKYASSPEKRDAIHIDVNHTPDEVSVRVVRPSEWRGGMGAKFVIKAPRRVQLDRIASSNGPLRISDIEGSARLKTSNGSVRTANLRGSLDAHTSNGAIEVQALEGNAVLRTSNGRIHADEVRGSVDASTSNNGISVRMARVAPGASVQLETSNGGVDLTLDQANPGDVRISTSNNGITVHLPQDANARLSAHTSNNSINSEFEVKTQGVAGKNHLEGVIGKGGPALDLKTNNGRIRLLKL
jgi:DUF4097 and DUF4098 domain-containing protein YvlB